MLAPSKGMLLEPLVIQLICNLFSTRSYLKFHRHTAAGSALRFEPSYLAFWSLVCRLFTTSKGPGKALSGDEHREDPNVPEHREGNELVDEQCSFTKFHQRVG